MSGKPNPEGVKEFRIALKRMTDAAYHLSKKRKMAAELTKEIADHETDYRRASEALFDLMDAMDIRSSHNAGWEQRILWFLAEFQRQHEKGE